MIPLEQDSAYVVFHRLCHNLVYNGLAMRRAYCEEQGDRSCVLEAGDQELGQ